MQCPHCGSSRVYQRKTRPGIKCAGCGRQFSPDTGTARYRRKKSPDWYDEIDKLHAGGMSAHQIAQTGVGDYKSVWGYLKRHEHT